MKVALIQQQYHNNIEETKQKTKEMIRSASKEGAKLVVLQELHTTLYFCQSEDTTMFELAEAFDENRTFFSQVAREFEVVLVTSLFEKRIRGVYHNTAVVFDVDGSEAGKYRKHHIPDDPGFYEKFYFTPGDEGFEPIETSVGRLGVMICWDQWYPEAARLMSLAGADMLIYPTAIGWFDSDEEDEKASQLNSWLTIQKSHSVANGIAVMAVNRVGFEPDPSGVLEGTKFWGNSFVTNTRGDIIAQGSSDQEEIIYAEVDISEQDATRQIWPFFRDRRIDQYGELTKRVRD
jgi:N-carbamoylputrescine amidase